MVRPLTFAIVFFSLLSAAHAKGPELSYTLTNDDLQKLIQEQFQRPAPSSFDVLKCAPKEEWTDTVTDMTDEEAINVVATLTGYPPASISTIVNSQRIRDVYRECGLTDAELAAIYSYTGSFYWMVNTALRQKNMHEIQRLAPMIRLINSGLGKLANYEDYSYRGGSLPSDELGKHNTLYNYIPYLGYTSSSRSPNIAKNFGGLSLFLMLPKTCKYIAPISSLQHEEEVLCKPGTEFKVKAQFIQGSTKYWLMEELDPLEKYPTP